MILQYFPKIVLKMHARKKSIFDIHISISKIFLQEMKKFEVLKILEGDVSRLDGLLFFY